MTFKVHMPNDKECRVMDTSNWKKIKFIPEEGIVVFIGKNNLKYIYPDKVIIEFGPFEDVPDTMDGKSDD